MVSYVWHGDWPAPTELTVRQVYAWVVDDALRVLMVRMPDGWSLPGGRPEPYDADWEATLRREVIEEADVTLRDLVPLGFQEVREDGRAPYAQLRIAARVEEWQESTPDPDTGLVYPRSWVPLPEAVALLDWGAEGDAQGVAVERVAREVYGISTAELESDAS